MNILRDLYPNVCTLDAYLTQLFEQEICTNSEQKNTNSWWIHFDDTLEFRLLLRCTLVAYSERPQPIARPLSTTITTVHHAATHTKWISHILAKLVMKIDEDELSCTEARIKTLSQEYMRCHQDQRSLINELKSMPWRILSQRIGKKAFEHLLLKVTLFRALPNQCIYQLWGKSVAQEIPSAKSNQKISTLKRKKEIKQIERRTMFYARFVKYKKHAINFGFANDHIFNQIDSTTMSTTQSSTVFSLLEDVFPKQFNTQKRVYSRRLQSKVPWRLKQAEPLFVQMIQRYTRCNITGLLLCHCPVTWDASTLNEISILDVSSSYFQVISFVNSVMRRIIPIEMWGSIENKKAIYRFIQFKQNETLTIDEMMMGFKISHCKWIGTSKTGASMHKTPTESEKQKEIAVEWIKWVFVHFIMPLIQGCFYVTESGVYKNRSFYFRHDIWKRMTDAHLQQLLQSHYIPKKPNTTMGETVARIRLIPKMQGFRCIASQQHSSSASVSKAQLDRLHNVLKFIKKANESPFFGPISGWIEISQKIQAYQLHLDLTKQPRPLYFFRIDIQTSFDTIPQDKLITAIKQMLNKEYSVHNYKAIIRNEGKLNIKSKGCASYPLTKFTLESFVNEVQPKPTNSVISESRLDLVQSSEELLEILVQHINNYRIRIGKQQYHQTVGLPQGSMLSTILCVLYYTFMCREVIIDHHEDDLFVHYVDDFICISPSKTRALNLYQQIYQTFPTYGCNIQTKKSLSNFEGIDMPVLSNYAKEFPWCGLLINTASLNVRWQHDKFQLDALRNATQLDRTNQSCSWILDRLKRCMHSYLDPLLMNETINSRETLLSNVFRAYCGLANRLHLILATHCRTAGNAIFIGVVMPLVYCCNQFIRGPYKSIHFCEIKWLAMYAFFSVLQSRPTKYRQLITRLKEKIYHLQYKTVRFRHIAMANTLFLELQAY